MGGSVGTAVLVNAIFSAGGLLGGYSIKYILDRRREAESRRFADKRKHYQNLILAIKGLAEGEMERETLFWFERAFIWLYAPDEVLKKANAVANVMGSSPADLTGALGELVLEMRRDMGFKATKLTPGDFSC